METGVSEVQGSHNLSCSVRGSASPSVQEGRPPPRPPYPQYGVKRLYPPLYKLAIVPTPYVVVGPTEW